MKYNKLLSTDGYIIYNKHLAHTIGVEEAIILGLLCSKYSFYESTKQLTIIDGNEYFYCTREFIEKETALKEDRQRRVMKTLEQYNILEIKKVGLPSKNYYHINEEALDKLFEVASTSGGDLPELEVVNSHSSNNKVLDTKVSNTNNNNNNKSINPKQSSGLFPTKTSNTLEVNDKDIVKESIEHLNKVLGTNYKETTTNTVTNIKALVKAKYTLEDIKCVIDYKYKEWKGTDMEKYLRPDTLFRLSKFESYINNARRGTRINSKNKFNDTDDGRQLQKAFRDLPKEEQEKILAKNKDGSLITF